MKKFIIRFIIILSFLCTSSRSEENSESIKYFETTPLTLMDLGLLNVHNVLKTIKVEGLTLIFNARHDKIKNMLEFSCATVAKNENEPINDKAKIEELCKEIMHKMRERLLVNTKTGKPLFSSCMSGYFTSSSYNVPLSYYQELDKICHLSVLFKVDDKKYVEYEGMLLGNDFNFKY